MLLLRRLLKNFCQKNSGYTTLELLVAMQLTFIIIGLAYSSYLFSNNLLQKWQHRTFVETQLALLSNILSEHLWNIRQIRYTDSRQILAVDISGDSLQLKLDKQLFINQDTLLISPLKLKEGKILYFLKSEISDEISQYSGAIDSQKAANIRAIQLELHLTCQNREFSLVLLSRLWKMKPVIISD